MESKVVVTRADGSVYVKYIPYASGALMEALKYANAVRKHGLEAVVFYKCDSLEKRESVWIEYIDPYYA